MDGLELFSFDSGQGQEAESFENTNFLLSSSSSPSLPPPLSLPRAFQSVVELGF